MEKRQAKRDNRRRSTKALGDLLPSLGGASFRKFGFLQTEIVRRWPEIAGPDYGARTVLVSLRFPKGERKNGTLTVGADGPDAMTLPYIEAELIERVNRYFGYAAVGRIRVSQVKVDSREAARPLAAPTPEAMAEADLLASAVQAPALRARLASFGAAILSSDRG